VTTIALNYPGDGFAFISFTPYNNFPSGYPFTFTYSIYSVWDLSKITSALTSVVVNTVNNPSGELNIAITATDFPASASPCFPYAVAPPTTTLNCNVGDSTSSTSLACTDASYVCGISVSTGLYSCIPPTNECYNCGCNGVSTIPSGYVCCNTNNCNLGTAATLSCTTPTPSSGAGFISVGFLVTLFVAVFMKWFN